MLLPVPVTISGAIVGDAMHVKLDADWLVCKIECIPQYGTFELDVPVNQPTVAHTRLFEQALAARPANVIDAEAVARVADNALHFEVRGLPADVRNGEAEVFPEIAGVVDNPAPVRQQWNGETWTASWPLSAQRSDSPASFPLVLIFGDGRNLRVVAQPRHRVARRPKWRTPAARPRRPRTILGTRSQPGFLTALLFALLGGVILNLMPCVFPVLSFKMLAVTQHAGDARQRWTGALAYTAGVVLSFLALAGLLIAARAGGEQLGWGFQLQSPGTVVALAALFTFSGSTSPACSSSVRCCRRVSRRCVRAIPRSIRFSPACWPRRSRRRARRRSWVPRWAPRSPGPPRRAHGVRRAGAGGGRALSMVCAVPAVGRWMPPPGRLDADLQGGAGVPDVRHGHLARLGAGPPGRRRRAAALLLVLLVLALAAWWWGQRPADGLKRHLSTGAIALLVVGAPSSGRSRCGSPARRRLGSAQM